MDNTQSKSLYERAEEWLRTCRAGWVTERALSLRFGLGGFEAAALAEALEIGGVLGYSRPPYGQRCNFVRQRKGKE